MTEIFRLFRLGLDEEYKKEFQKVGYENFTQSMALEEGTKLMFGGHIPGDFTKQIVVEHYASEEAYEEHIKSPHFKAFADLAKVAFISREMVSLTPKIFLQKSKDFRIFESESLLVKLAIVTVTDSEGFAEIVLPEMRLSMEKEEGVLIMYAGTDVESPNTWYFFEVYQDEKAYELHRETQHFKAYIEESASLVLDKQLHDVILDMLVNRGK